MKVAAELCAALKPVCERLIAAGSLRRRKPTVGDAEILYIGKTEVRQDPADMFASITVNLADEVITALDGRDNQQPGSSMKTIPSCDHRCEWLWTLSGEGTCQRPATHERMDGKPLRYCADHAKQLSPYVKLRLLPPQNAALGVPPDAVLEECACCHELNGLWKLTWTGKQMLCDKCAESP